ncbi:hypothetical protein HK102_013488 [Quaeritorhiza haematococci]|nr:hypothetical protein HK102_013488 [Quaeritorhiza haematococci]
MVEDMVRTLMTQVDISDRDTSSPWTQLITADAATDSDLPISIYSHTSLSHSFLIKAILSNTPEVTFDHAANLVKRPEWDEVCEEVKVVKDVQDVKGTKIVYVRFKGAHGRKGRDLVLLVHVRRWHDGRYLQVARSVEVPEVPVYDGYVRAKSGVSGVVVAPVPNETYKSFLTQVLADDPQADVRRSVLRFVASKSIPTSVRKMNSRLEKMPPKSLSELVAF